MAKAVAVLNELARSAEAASISDLARRIGLPKSSVADLVSTLVTLGFLSRDRHGRYLLGHHIVELARGLVGGHRLLEVFADACGAVPDANGETVVMSVLDGADIAIVAVRQGNHRLPITTRIGLRLPVWSTAAGRCFLDALPEGEIAELLSTVSSTSTGVSGSLPKARSLADDLAGERRRGFYVDDQSTATGMTSFSAPVVDSRTGAVVAAVAIACRSENLTPGRFDGVGAAARAIAAECIRKSAATTES